MNSVALKNTGVVKSVLLNDAVPVNLTVNKDYFPIGTELFCHYISATNIWIHEIVPVVSEFLLVFLCFCSYE